MMSAQGAVHIEQYEYCILYTWQYMLFTASEYAFIQQTFCNIKFCRRRIVFQGKLISHMNLYIE